MDVHGGPKLRSSLERGLGEITEFWSKRVFVKGNSQGVLSCEPSASIGVSALVLQTTSNLPMSDAEVLLTC